MFHLVVDQSESDRCFDVWETALQLDCEQRGKESFWISPGRVLAHFYWKDGRRHSEFDYHGHGRPWTVQINRPRTVGDANSLTAVAVDSKRRRWLLRQGWLRSNRSGGPEVRHKDFQDGTQLNAVPVEVGSGPADREWFVICCLDEGEGIAESTADFVARCAMARDLVDGLTTSADIEVQRQQYGAPEVAGSYSTPARPLVPPAEVWKVQAYVCEAFDHELKRIGSGFPKPKHAAGYEADGECITDKGSFLVEIKTDISASSIHSGVGQLMLYQKLMPSTAGHKLVLLLPEEPCDCLISAIRSLNISLAYFGLRRGAGQPHVTFTAEFRDHFGLLPAE